MPSVKAAAPLPANVVTTPPAAILRMRLFPVSEMKTFPAVSTATPRGKLKAAFVPVPSANAADPLPAKVLTTPPGDTLRMRWLEESTTNTLPMESMDTPQGPLNEALVPAPSAKAAVPLPASVDTTPPGVILRMRLPSETRALPTESRARPTKNENKAPVPVPSAYPLEPPANVLTTPLGVTLRTRKKSATKTCSLPSTAIAMGRKKEALVPAPSVYAIEPLPAIVLTAPAGVTFRMRELTVSATYTLPLELVAIPKGVLNEAPAWVPSANAAAPLPASNVTAKGSQPTLLVTEPKGHAPGQAQGVALAELRGQKKPAGQSTGTADKQK